MVTREKKERLCMAHRTLLELVFYMGKGLMYKKHILRYMSEFEGINEIDTSKVLKELRDSDIVDSHSVFGAKVIRLKKFAIYFLLEKDREDVSSITLTAGKVKKSAFLNQIVLQSATILKKRNPSLPLLIQYYQAKTTYLSKDKESFSYLENQIQEGWCTPYARQEVNDLKIAKQQGHVFKKNDAEEKIQRGYNLNSMQASNIYLGLKRKASNGKTVVYVDVLDINGLMTAKQFAKKVGLVVDYLDLLFDREDLTLTFYFLLHVQSQERKDFLQKQEKQINESIRTHCKEDIPWDINNLDLERTLFKNQKVLLNV